tara:strand:- start:474 stop:1304 length:831 start_codon:yes stop_codon:yes gene_type:complete
MDTNITEKVERYNEIGQVVRVTLRWRGKIYYLQMFFPGSKFPSRGEVETQVKKIYPDAVVMIHYASETQPNQPLIRVSEDVERDEYGDPVGGPKISKKEKEKNLKKNEKDEDHTTTTAEGTLKYGNYGNYVDGQKTQPKIKEYINPRKLPVANASYEPEGEIMNEQQMNDKPNKPGSGVKNVKGKPFTQKVTNFIQQGLKNINKQVEKNPAGMTLQNMSQEPEGEVIKEEEKENPTFVQFMKRIDQLPEVTREAIKNCGNDPAIAKAALEISGIDK